jgi:hypothetical protein
MVPSRFGFSSANDESFADKRSGCHEESVHRFIGSSNLE